jgi:radical SAM superfamily enzyme YgiQ (UPF0313 family)
MKFSEFNVLLVYPNLQMINLMPMNISVLSAYLKAMGFQVKLFDTTLYKMDDKSIDERRVDYLQVRPFDLAKYGIRYKETDVYDDFRRYVDDYKPDLIAISIVEDTLPLALKLLETVRDTNIPVVAGGVHVILNQKETLACEDIDMICTGEGEYALADICVNMCNGFHWRNANICGIDTKTAHNKPQYRVNLDELPYNDFTVFERERFYRPMQGKVFRMIPIETDRGCPYTCTFCAAPYLRKYYDACGEQYYRVKSIPRVMDELSYQVEKYGAQYIYFTAETFLAMGNEKLKKLAEDYKRDIKLPFWCQTRVDTITDERIKIIKEMGCDRVSIGIEHGNEEFRKSVLKKRFTNQQAIDAFNILEKYKIPVTVNNMIGFPGETRELAFDTIYLNRQLTADTTNCFAFKPYHGTSLRDVAIKKGYLDPNVPVHSLVDATLDMPKFPKEEVNGILRTFPLYIKFPEERFDEIRVAERDDLKYMELAKEYRKKCWGIE